jgi:hypothetical protein
MQQPRLGERLLYGRFGAAPSWRDVYAHPHPQAHVLYRLDEGQVVHFLAYRYQGPVLWVQVRVTVVDPQLSAPACRRSFVGFVKTPAQQPETVLAQAPVRPYATGEVPGGVPSALALGDTVALVEGYPGKGEGVYKMVPLDESAPPDAGWIEPCDLARIENGPHRTANNVLYWQVRNLNGDQRGWVREAARVGADYFAKIRPYRLAQNR